MRFSKKESLIKESASALGSHLKIILGTLCPLQTRIRLTGSQWPTNEIHKVIKTPLRFAVMSATKNTQARATVLLAVVH